GPRDAPPDAGRPADELRMEVPGPAEHRQYLRGGRLVRDRDPARILELLVLVTGQRGHRADRPGRDRLGPAREPPDDRRRAARDGVALGRPGQATGPGDPHCGSKLRMSGSPARQANTVGQESPTYETGPTVGRRDRDSDYLRDHRGPRAAG